MQAALQEVYNGMPYLAERWWSVSHYVPSDWSDSGSGYISTFSLKAKKEHSSSGIFGINIEKGVWRINHRWSSGTYAPQVGTDPWQWAMFYTGNESGACYPRASGPSPLWADGVNHFPNQASSCAALKSLNKGGWTDWVINMKTDNRGSDKNGTGYLRVWKREDSGPWVHVLDIKPGKVTRGGLTFNHGIGYGSGTEGFGPKIGLYMNKNQVWNLPDNRVLYIANVKVGDEKTTFAEMSPDGSSPGSAAPDEELQSPPNPPTIAVAQ
jgi:hypothetical protein